MNRKKKETWSNSKDYRIAVAESLVILKASLWYLYVETVTSQHVSGGKTYYFYTTKGRRLIIGLRYLQGG